MAMNGLQGLVDCLESGSGEVQVDEPVRALALGCIDRMLDFVAARPAGVTAAQPKAGFVANIGAA
jgi:quinolinate synthase